MSKFSKEPTCTHNHKLQRTSYCKLKIAQISTVATYVKMIMWCQLTTTLYVFIVDYPFDFWEIK